jgi:hypothetical protein
MARGSLVDVRFGTSRGSQFPTAAAARPITARRCRHGHEYDAPHRPFSTASCLNGQNRIGPNTSRAWLRIELPRYMTRSTARPCWLRQTCDSSKSLTSRFLVDFFLIRPLEFSKVVTLFSNHNSLSLIRASESLFFDRCSSCRLQQKLHYIPLWPTSASPRA